MSFISGKKSQKENKLERRKQAKRKKKFGK